MLFFGFFLPFEAILGDSFGSALLFFDATILPLGLADFDVEDRDLLLLDCCDELAFDPSESVDDFPPQPTTVMTVKSAVTAQ